MHLIFWIITTSFWKISWDLNCAYRLDLLNCPPSCTFPSWPTQMFQKILSASHMNCNTTLWNFFLLKKSLISNVTFLFGRSTKGMWVLFIAPQMLSIPIKFSKWAMISFKRWPKGILMYLLNNLFLSINTSQTMWTYF